MILLFSAISSHSIFDFNKNSEVGSWMILDDVVMGGKSSSTFKLNDEGHGEFEGERSLDNNGGFSSVRHKFETTKINIYL
jgi:hypothetical protein